MDGGSIRFGELRGDVLSRVAGNEQAVPGGASGSRRPFGVPSLDDLGDLRDRHVLVRADLDLRTPAGSFAFTRRLGILVPTLNRLLEGGAHVTVCGHCGDLDGDGDEDAFRAVRRAVEEACPKVAFLPNLARPDEREGDGQLVSELVKDQDAFVNEAFQWSWLPLASIVGPPETLPSVAGLRLSADLELLEPLLRTPPRPFVVVFGSDLSPSRLPGLRGLILRADSVLVGGGMALPFLQAIGARPVEGPDTDLLRDCRRAYGISREIQHEVQLPSDLVFELSDGTVTVAPASAHVGGQVSDIGPTTRLRFGEVLKGAGSVLWTGALGRTEDERFAEGTKSVARCLPDGHVVLGGDALLATLGGAPSGSTGGVLSATDPAIALLKDGDLPGLAALRTSRPSPS